MFKVFGQFNGSENYSGLLRDVAVTAAQSFTANGWVLTPTGDAIAGGNTSWIEIAFRNAASNTLGLFRSAIINTNTPVGLWLNLAVTNQFDPVTFAVVGSVTNLIAPSGTAFARYQIVFRQPLNAAGAVLFDDQRFSFSGSSELPVSPAASKAGNNVNLAFPTFFGLAFRVRFKNDLSDPNWLLLTNVIGGGTTTIVSDGLGATRRFYQVTHGCD